MKKLNLWTTIVVTLLLVSGCNKEENPSDKSQITFKEFTVNDVSFKMIKVDGGTFDMGGTPEQGEDAWKKEFPVHQVTLSDYYIGETEVTQGLWEAVMGSNPSNHQGNPQYPVEMVTWSEVVKEFIPKLNELTGKTFTLPTEAQWEFAARGGNKSKGFKYSGSNDFNEVGWSSDNSNTDGEHESHPVGQKLPNELGLYDMSGNVFEWCLDWMGPYTEEPQTNPTGPESGDLRIIRSGFFYIPTSNCRVSSRSNYPDEKNYGIGFRLVLSL